jgi:hypothetical protein
VDIYLYPPVFAYVGETKELRENGLHQGEIKELAVGKAEKKQTKVGKAVWNVDRGGCFERTRVCPDTSQRMVASNLSSVKQYLVVILFEKYG